MRRFASFLPQSAAGSAFYYFTKVRYAGRFEHPKIQRATTADQKR